jgi:hypothetical protein
MLNDEAIPALRTGPKPRKVFDEKGVVRNYPIRRSGRFRAQSTNGSSRRERVLVVQSAEYRR